MSQPKVSVVITAYNRPDYLEAALNSALGQTYGNHEIIVVDDCSETDMSRAIKSLSGDIRYIRQSKNAGPSAARNRGVALASGDYVAFLDDDDQWLPNKLERQVAAMNGHEACLCGFTFLDRDKNQVHPINVVTGDLLRQGNIFCGASGFMARRDALVACPFDGDLSSGEEWDVYVRISQRGSIAYVPDPLFLYRLGAHESITTRARTMTIPDIGGRVAHIYKNRDWLGETRYRILLARKILEYIGAKPNKFRFLVSAIRHAGLGATMNVLWKKALRSQDPLATYTNDRWY